MARHRRGKLGAVLIVAVLATSLAGCGRRGRLEPPPDPTAPVATNGDRPDGVGKSGVHRRPKNPPITAPNDSFVLDPLL